MGNPHTGAQHKVDITARKTSNHLTARTYGFLEQDSMVEAPGNGESVRKGTWEHVFTNAIHDIQGCGARYPMWAAIDCQFSTP